MEFIWLALGANRFMDGFASGFPIRFAESVDSLPRILADGEPSALIIEIGSGADADPAFLALDAWREHLPVWILDSATSVPCSVRWIKLGAAQVATDEREITELMRAHSELRAPRRRRTAIVGDSRAMNDLEDRIELVADRRCTVLIEGETGTGKEVVAKAIHAAGSRARAPWVAVNCAAIPETLLEAELFGYVKGAFTGAVQARAGKFEAANRGTIFLDEIGDMPLAVQAKLLRVLQEREVERLGGNETVRLDVRVIAATNVNLAERVREGSFRQDLYYRLNVFRMALPPLRERRGDIPSLASHFTARICAGERLPVKSLDSCALDKLMSHSWPGNVRELENTIETAVVSSGNRVTIFPSDITWGRPSALRQTAEPHPSTLLPADGLDYERVIEDFEKSLLAQALARTRGNKTAAASLLNMKRTTLAARMRALESRMPRLVA
jgi:transcriptional regulator with GAF, ATPase, and Fis domain